MIRHLRRLRHLGDCSSAASSASVGERYATTLPRPPHWVVVVALGLAPASSAIAQPTCPEASLPAYSHNDYTNPRPLHDALELGYRGVEVDVYLVHGVLRVGHNRYQAQRAGTLEALYLAPLRALIDRCGVLAGDDGPFLVTIELKERSYVAYDSLNGLLQRYADMLATFEHGVAKPGPIEVVLVGWHPTPAEMRHSSVLIAQLQYRLTKARARIEPEDLELVRLISLDYGKTMGRWWLSDADRQEWLAALRDAKTSAPDLRLRVYNLPRDVELYRILRQSGVDLIGVKSAADARKLRGELNAPNAPQ